MAVIGSNLAYDHDCIRHPKVFWMPDTGFLSVFNTYFHIPYRYEVINFFCFRRQNLLEIIITFWETIANWIHLMVCFTQCFTRGFMPLAELCIFQLIRRGCNPFHRTSMTVSMWDEQSTVGLIIIIFTGKRVSVCDVSDLTVSHWPLEPPLHSAAAAALPNVMLWCTMVLPPCDDDLLRFVRYQCKNAKTATTAPAAKRMPKTIDTWIFNSWPFPPWAVNYTTTNKDSR